MRSGFARLDLSSWTAASICSLFALIWASSSGLGWTGGAPRPPRCWLMATAVVKRTARAKRVICEKHIRCLDCLVPAREEDRAACRVADQEQERVIGAERDRRRERGEADAYSRRGGCLGAFLG